MSQANSQGRRVEDDHESTREVRRPSQEERALTPALLSGTGEPSTPQHQTLVKALEQLLKDALAVGAKTPGPSIHDNDSQPRRKDAATSPQKRISGSPSRRINISGTYVPQMGLLGLRHPYINTHTL